MSQTSGLAPECGDASHLKGQQFDRDADIENSGVLTVHEDVEIVGNPPVLLVLRAGTRD
jgi:hypothetical protein